MIPTIYLFLYGQYSWLGFCQMVEKSNIFYWESELEFSFFGRGKYVVAFHDSCQKNKELSKLSRRSTEQGRPSL